MTFDDCLKKQGFGRNYFDIALGNRCGVNFQRISGFRNFLTLKNISQYKKTKTNHNKKNQNKYKLLCN